MWLINCSNPIMETLVIRGDNPPPELLFAVMPELSMEYRNEDYSLDEPIKHAVLVYRYIEAKQADNEYIYKFQGVRIT